MDETNNQDNPTENNGDNVNDNSNIADEDSDDEEEVGNVDKYEYCLLDKKVLQRLQQNDPTITSLQIRLDCNDDGECFFNSIDWKVDSDCIANNTQLKGLFINYQVIGAKHYILGKQGNKLPTRQQLQDFFSCIYRNSSIKALSFRSIEIIDEFGGSLIEGLKGHPSIKKIEIDHGRLVNIGCGSFGKVLRHPTSKLKDLRLPFLVILMMRVSAHYVMD